MDLPWELNIYFILCKQMTKKRQKLHNEIQLPLATFFAYFLLVLGFLSLINFAAIYLISSYFVRSLNLITVNDGLITSGQSMT